MGRKLPSEIDYVVVGSGMGSLYCSALLAKASNRPKIEYKKTQPRVVACYVCMHVCVCGVSIFSNPLHNSFNLTTEGWIQGGRLGTTLRRRRFYL